MGHTGFRKAFLIIFCSTWDVIFLNFVLNFVANRPTPITLFWMLYFYNLRLYYCKLHNFFEFLKQKTQSIIKTSFETGSYVKKMSQKSPKCHKKLFKKLFLLVTTMVFEPNLLNIKCCSYFTTQLPLFWNGNGARWIKKNNNYCQLRSIIRPTVLWIKKTWFCLVSYLIFQWAEISQLVDLTFFKT